MANPIPIEVISTVAYPAYSAVNCARAQRLSDDVFLNTGAAVKEEGPNGVYENKLWLVQGIFTTDKEIANNIITNCIVVKPKLMCKHADNTHTYQMEPNYAPEKQLNVARTTTLTPVY